MSDYRYLTSTWADSESFSFICEPPPKYFGFRPLLLFTETTGGETKVSFACYDAPSLSDRKRFVPTNASCSCFSALSLINVDIPLGLPRPLYYVCTTPLTVCWEGASYCFGFTCLLLSSSEDDDSSSTTSEDEGSSGSSSSSSDSSSSDSSSSHDDSLDWCFAFLPGGLPLGLRPPLNMEEVLFYSCMSACSARFCYWRTLLL